jgi:tetratricopeptide (TPR) repeat protein
MISVTRIFRLGIRFAAWVTPHAKEWHRQRHLNRVEGERHLAARNWAEAENHLTLALAERRHPSKVRLDLLLGLMEAQRKQGKTPEAEQTTQTAVALATSSKDKVFQSRALDALAEIQLDQKKYSAAEQTLAQIEKLENSLSNPDHKRLASAARNLGTVLQHSGRNEEAMKAFERAADLSEKTYGPDHVETANALTELGARHRDAGNHAEAQKVLRRSLEIHRKASGIDSHAATQDLFHLATSLEESGDIEGATAEYERVLAVKERQIGGDLVQTAETQAHLAAIYMRAGRTSAARELLTHSIGVLDRKKGDERLEFALETMAALEDLLNRPEQAQRWREKAAQSVALRTAPAPELAADPAKQFPKYY